MDGLKISIFYEIQRLLRYEFVSSLILRGGEELLIAQYIFP